MSDSKHAKHDIGQDQDAWPDITSSLLPRFHVSRDEYIFSERKSYLCTATTTIDMRFFDVFFDWYHSCFSWCVSRLYIDIYIYIRMMMMVMMMRRRRRILIDTVSCRIRPLSSLWIDMSRRNTPLCRIFDDDSCARPRMIYMQSVVAVDAFEMIQSRSRPLNEYNK